MSANTKTDPYADAMCHETARKLVKLACLRRIECAILWNGKEYVCNGDPCGPSVHGVYEWLDKQPARMF